MVPRERTFPAAGQNLGPIKPNGEVRKIVVLVLQLAKVIPRFEECLILSVKHVSSPRVKSPYLENSKASLAMRLSPLLAFRIPELDRSKTCPCHAKVRRVKNITGGPVHVDGAVAETKDLESREFAAQMHRHQLGSAFLIIVSDRRQDIDKKR